MSAGNGGRQLLRFGNNIRRLASPSVLYAFEMAARLEFFSEAAEQSAEPAADDGSSNEAGAQWEGIDIQ